MLPHCYDYKMYIFMFCLFLCFAGEREGLGAGQISRIPGSAPVHCIGESFVMSLFTFCFISIHFQVEKETR